METIKVFATGAVVAGGVVIAALFFSLLMSISGAAGAVMKLVMLVAAIYGIGRIVRHMQ
jgi:hypothetical protein